MTDRCPHIRRKHYEEVDWCWLYDKPCLLESDEPCPEWEEIKKEWENERRESPDNL